MTDIPDKSVSVETKASMQWTYLDPELRRMDHPKKFQDGDSNTTFEIKILFKTNAITQPQKSRYRIKEDHYLILFYSIFFDIFLFDFCGVVFFPV